MIRNPTNSLILTHLHDDLASDPQSLARILAEHGAPSELVYLPRFKRYIIICHSTQDAQDTKTFLARALGDRAHVSYSLRDNALNLPYDGSWALKAGTGDTDYLEVPLEEGTKRFLILPPMSPQSEWDNYDQVEEGPNKKSIYSPDELSYLLWDRLGGFDSTQVRRFEEELSDDTSDVDMGPRSAAKGDLPVYDFYEKEHILFELIPDGLPAIVVDKVSNRDPHPKKSIPKTSIPPRKE